MNKKLALLAAPVVMLAATAATAENLWGITPLFGADAQWRHMDFQRGFGENVFRHNYPQGDVYVGLKFNDYIGIQAGYEATSRKTETVTLLAPVTVNGVVLASTPGAVAKLDSVQFSSTARIKGPHLDLVGYLPISDEYKVQLVGSVGIANLKATIYRQTNTVTRTVNNRQISTPTSTPPVRFHGRKTVLRLVGGVQHYIADYVGVRAIVGWEDTKRLQNKLFATAPGTTGVLKVRPKDSVFYGLGLFVTL